MQPHEITEDNVVAFEAKRIVRTYTQTINGTPEAIFPLLCPVREAEWLDGWAYMMLFSKSGVAEEGAVFSTPSEGEPDTIWVVTRHDPITYEVEFARVTPGSRACTLLIEVRAKDGRSSFVDIVYTYTGLTPSGNAFLDGYTEAVFLEMVQFWERSMNHFLETGNKIVIH
jgi:hypothetical protein